MQFYLNKDGNQNDFHTTVYVKQNATSIKC